jgi:(5-formylfuran-3-yl)methyl phosphate synthase
MIDPQPTRLLVSVRSAAEAQIALDAGVDLIDLKEPRAGALGAVAPATAADVVRAIGGRAALSMALGELRDRPRLPVPAGIRWAKLGLAGCAGRDDWRRSWAEAAAALPGGCGLVAVVYADFEKCGAPSPDLVLREAVRVGAGAVLVDTAVKNGRGLLDWWTADAVHRLAGEARAQGMLSVVGGALTAETIPHVAACGVDYVAVRGAACDGDRNGPISTARIGAIRELLG